MNNNANEDDVIKRIKLLGGEYDPVSSLTLETQLWICESLVKELGQHNTCTNDNVNTNANAKWNGNANVPRKLNTNSFLTEDKIRAINKLTTFNYKTPPIQIAENLLAVFANQNSKENHWLYLAQKWNPKSINSVINQILKEQELGWKTIQNPAAYFTKLVNFRKKRRGQ